MGEKETTKHTQGEWVITSPENAPEYTYVSDGGELIYVGKNKKTAKLIAAAPTMLKTLIEIKAYIDLDKEFREMLSEEIQEAIEKATK